MVSHIGSCLPWHVGLEKKKEQEHLEITNVFKRKLGKSVPSWPGNWTSVAGHLLFMCLIIWVAELTGAKSHLIGFYEFLRKKNMLKGSIQLGITTPTHTPYTTTHNTQPYTTHI